MRQQNIIWFDQLTMKDVGIVGGKNASLGEMISSLNSSKVLVPGGFATTAHAYRTFLQQNGLHKKIEKSLNSLDVNNIIDLAKVGKQIQTWILETEFTQEFEQDIENAYNRMCALYGSNLSVAIRSSATAEDLPEASFAGQQDTHLNITNLDDVKVSIKKVFASLYNDRAISYRIHQGFSGIEIALSAGVQKMVRSDLATSGVMFTVDTESGFDKVVLINASYGLGESIVSGMVNPDEFYLYKDAIRSNKIAIIRKNIGSKMVKMQFNHAASGTQSVNVEDHQRKQFSISDEIASKLAMLAITIEEHYKKPMDIEWGIDGIDNQIYILQARPETAISSGKYGKQMRYQLSCAKTNALVHGRAIGQKAAHGIVKIINNPADMHKITAGDVLVTDMTDPDWEPVMKKASAIVTNRGGRTCHAAIIARELGVPAIVGCDNATDILKDGMHVTVSCCEGDIGRVYEGILNIETTELSNNAMPALPIKIMMNVGNPELAFSFAQIPNYGVGLARLEFIINRQIGIHPKALIEYDSLPTQLKQTIKNRTIGYSSPINFYIDKLAEGIATIACAFYPKPVIVRLSDFKSNEYSNLIGGNLYEPVEENPMLGFRGASRYSSPMFKDCFELECMAIYKVINEIGLDNIAIMIPFVRTTSEVVTVIKLLEENGLVRGQNNLKIYMMCEIPSNAILAEQFLEHVDGFSIGSNDMTQLTLGIDRDSSGTIAATFDERNDAVKALLHLSIDACKKMGKYVGICGQGPSDHPDFAKWLINEGIDSISLNPDTVIATWMYLGKES